MLTCLFVAYGFCQTQENQTHNPQHTCTDRLADIGSHSLALTDTMFERSVLKASLATVVPGTPFHAHWGTRPPLPTPAHPSQPGFCARQEVAEPSAARKSARSDSSPTLFVYS